MDLTEKVKGYICCTDIIRDYNVYNGLLGNDAYNHFYTFTASMGRALFDVSSIALVESLAEGKEKEAGIAALLIGCSFLVDRALKYSRKIVIDHKKIKK
jgi:hypothetical protein